MRGDPMTPDIKVTSAVPNHQFLMWSHIALAADMALDNLRAAMIAAPRFCTVWEKRESILVFLPISGSNIQE